MFLLNDMWNILHNIFVLLSGTIGNILSFIIYSRPMFRNSMTSFLFRVLAVTDTLALNYGTWDNWLRYVRDGPVFTETKFYCKFSTYLRFLLADLPVWVLVLVSIERVIGVTVPHRARLLITKKRTIGALIFLYIFLMCYNIPMYISPGSEVSTVGNVTIYKCKTTQEYRNLAYHVIPWMDLVIYALLPLLLMLVSSIIIITIVVRRKKMLGAARSKSSDTNALTITLLTVCFVFMLLTLPHALYSLLIDPLWPSYRTKIDFYAWRFLAGFLRYVNNAINFFLYCLSGQPFRKEFLKLLCFTSPKKDTLGNSTHMTVISKSNVSNTSISQWKLVGTIFTKESYL